MKTQGDTKRPHCVKAEFDPDFSATPLGGVALAEKTFRSLGLRRVLNKHLPERPKGAGFSACDGALALMTGLLLGGRGIAAAEVLRQDSLAMEILGLAGVASSPTMYRILCDLSGLSERVGAEWYEPNGPALAALDMLGGERITPATRRIVPDEAEHGSPQRLEALSVFLQAVARVCLNALPREIVRQHGWSVVFGDGTDLEVEGNCFDAARMGRNGKRLIRWLTLMMGPVIVSQRLMEGNKDEGVNMPDLIEEGRSLVRETAGKKGRVLALLDAAYFERRVVETIETAGWDFIICANQQRNVLERLAQEQPDFVWQETGPDARRGWIESQMACFTHMPEGWAKAVTIVARRWREEGDLPGVWRWSFLSTRLEPEELPCDLRKKHGYASSIWMLYGTKQGRETHYKTPLCDLGLHHPPSCRLGLNQAFYALAAAASNVAMVLRYRVVDKTERGIELWRLRQRYLQMAGYLVRTGRTLWVELSGVSVDALRQTLWQRAFAEAGRL